MGSWTLFFFFSFVLWSILLTTTGGQQQQLPQYSQCPNVCSGHGKCSSDSVCHCDNGWDVVADCSQRRCPYDVAWADKAYAMDMAHTRVECSNNGLCNRKTGQCQCFEGYRGKACEKSGCYICLVYLQCQYKECSGHGNCITTGEAYEIYKATPHALEYTNWDKNHTTFCDCERGYNGPVCNNRMCPKGLDPINLFSPNYYTINVTIAAESGHQDMTGTMQFTFNGESFDFPANTTAWTELECQRSFESLQAIKEATCFRTDWQITWHATYTVQIKKWITDAPYETNFYTNDGNPPLSAFSCGSKDAKSGRRTHVVCTLTIANYHNQAPPAYTYCSNRGVCNLLTGTCKCNPGYTNANCDTYLTHGDLFVLKSKDVLSITSSYENTTMNSKFTKDVLNLHADGFQTTATTTFNWIQMVDSVSTRTKLDALGNLNMYVGGIYVHGGGLGTNPGMGQGGVSVWNNGMKVQSSLSVNSGGLVVATNGFTLSSGGLIIGAGGLACTGGLTVRSELRGGLLKGLIVQGGMTSANNGMIITQDGIKGVVGGINVGTAGFTVTDGLTIASGGVYLNKKGWMSIWNSGLWVTRGGISINNHVMGAGLKGGMLMTGGITVYSGGLVVKNPGGLYENNAGIFIEKGGVSIGNGGTYVPAKIDVLGYGCRVWEGLSINTQGLSINGGLTITSGGFSLTSGMPITGGVSILSGGLIMTDGLTIPADGISVHGSITVLNGGFKVANGLTVNMYRGMGLKDTLTVYDSGMVVTGGGTVYNSGLFVTAPGYITVQSKGLRVVDGGMTVFSGGLSLVGYPGGFGPAQFGLKVRSMGLYVTGGMTLINDVPYNEINRIGWPGTAMVVSGGLTVTANGVYINTGGLINAGKANSLTSNGLFITGGLTINAANIAANYYATTGLWVTGGVTIPVSGLHITGGISVKSTGIVVSTGGLTLFTGGLATSMLGISIRTGGLKVTNGANVNLQVLTKGLWVSTGGLSVKSNGLVVTTGGMTVLSDGHGMILGTGGTGTSVTVMNAGAMIIDGGLTISTLGLKTSIGMTINAGGLYLTGGLTVAGVSPMILFKGMTINSGGLKVTGGVQEAEYIYHGDPLPFEHGVVVWTSGLIVQSYTKGCNVGSGMTVNNGGFLIGTYGTTINFQGLKVTGGLTVYTGGVAVGSAQSVPPVIASVSVANTGLNLIDGGSSGRLSVATNGVKISSGGFSLPNSGLPVTGGVTIANKGLTVTGGMTIYDYVHSDALPNGLGGWGPAFTVANAGMLLTGGMTVNVDGLYVGWSQWGQPTVTGGITVADGGVYVGDGGYGMSLQSGTMMVTGGLTITSTTTSAGLKITGGLTINGGLIVTTGGLTIKKGGLVITDGLTVVTSGIWVKNGGATVYGTSFFESTPTWSDMRLKKDIVRMKQALEMVRQLQGVSYNWVTHTPDGLSARNKSGLLLDDRRHIGVIAQDLQKVLPEAVVPTGLDEKYLGVVYTDLIPLLVEAVRELDERTERLGKDNEVIRDEEEGEEEEVEDEEGERVGEEEEERGYGQREGWHARSNHTSSTTPTITSISNSKINSINTNSISSSSSGSSSSDRKIKPSICNRAQLLQEIAELSQLLTTVEAMQRELELGLTLPTLSSIITS